MVEEGRRLRTNALEAITGRGHGPSMSKTCRARRRLTIQRGHVVRGVRLASSSLVRARVLWLPGGGAVLLV